MPRRAKPTVAICYDFDGTLSPRNMQEFDFIPQLSLTSGAFWGRVKEMARQHDADEILAYMRLMVEEATHANLAINREAIRNYGKTVELFPGVSDWFNRINAFGKGQGVRVEHFIISSGLKEMIEGSPIAKAFTEIFASSFMYDQHDVAKWPALAVNYTTKTQFLFRINKGHLKVWDNSRINAYTPEEDRPVPFKRMIYIGDGSTDIPCMRLVKDQGGYSIAVYPPNSPKKKDATKLLEEGRVDYVMRADYTENSPLARQIRAVVSRIAADYVVEQGEKSPRKKASSAKRKPIENPVSDVGIAETGDQFDLEAAER